MADRRKFDIEERKVLREEKLRAEIIQLYHDVLAAEHREKWKTVELVTRNYWWSEVTKNVRKYVEGYDLCQRMKNRTEEVVGKLKLREVPEKLWTHLIVDFIMKLSIVVEKDMILVVCDKLSKMIYFVVIMEETSAEELARLFRNNL